MISYVFVDLDAGDRNSIGVHFLKNAKGDVVYGCLEWEVVWDDFDDVLNKNTQKFRSWSKDEGLIPATISDIEQAGLAMYINGRYNWNTMEFELR